MNASWTVPVARLRCKTPACLCSLDYDTVNDGHADRLFFHKDTCLTYSVLVELDNLIFAGGLAQDAFYRARVEGYRLTGGGDFISKTKFLEVYREWIRLTSVDSDALFTCPDCLGPGKDPTKVKFTWDGVALGIQAGKL